MIGHNELRLNTATVVEALNEYFRKRHSADVPMEWKISTVAVESDRAGSNFFVAKTIGVGTEQKA